ncbi:hypothetical protein SAMN02787142_2107 [Burkholderia sp. WP9]|uniref:hypothetical protein n=1 Tax=Burkholderia sp. WP9 TaxID=1500263 RepID=UPI00089A60EC|nr:hypothetical protein [Burkholderia sp. WP9]SEC87457.1 hypothetical protein SAMN02787142_2107 [Burkholderia sp. WP9]
MDKAGEQAALEASRATWGCIRYFPSASGRATMHHHRVWKTFLEVAQAIPVPPGFDAYQLSRVGTSIGATLRAEIPAIVIDEFWQAEQARIKTNDARLWSVVNIAVGVVRQG